MHFYKAIVVAVSVLVVLGVISIVAGKLVMAFGASGCTLLQSSPTGSYTLSLDEKSLCYKTDYRLIADETYHIHVAVTEELKDSTLPATPDGLVSLSDTMRMLWARPFQRSVSNGLFVLMGGVGDPRDGTFKIGSGTRIKPDWDGRLHFFVNDALCLVGCGDIWYFFKNNRGVMEITIRDSSDAQSR